MEEINKKEQIKINKYEYFDTETGKFYLNSEGLNIVYSEKGIICSYSGANEWINDFTLYLMTLVSGLSPYNHSINDCDYKKDLPKIFAVNPIGVIKFIKDFMKQENGKWAFKEIEKIIYEMPRYE